MDINENFPVISGALLQDFLGAAERMDFDSGEQLYEQGFPCPFVPFIVAGVVRVFKIGESGREITLYRVRPGEVCIMSTTCSVSNKEYPAIAEAEMPTTAYVIPGKPFRELMKKYEPLQDMIMDVMSARMVEMMTVIEEVAFWRVDLRLANRLLQETEPPKSNSVTTTHAQLAIELGSAREVISRILKDFERRGFVNLVRGKVEVTGRESLSEFRDDLHNSSL